MSRFFSSFLLVLSLTLVPLPAQTLPVTGPALPGMESLDTFMVQLIQKWSIPGAQLAIAKDGQLLFAKGYGYADQEGLVPVQPDSLFRIASVSKPITAVAVMKLLEEGKLKLADKAFALLGGSYPPLPNAQRDARLDSITVEDLLRHTGGWDRDTSFDPMFRPRTVANAVGITSPAGCGDVIRYMQGFPLQYAPGTKYAYSNFGFCILGRIIEKVTGQTYEQYVKQKILAPMKITRMTQGRSLPELRMPGEVKYYGYPGQPTDASAFPPFSQVPIQYGAFYIEAMDSHGAWLASAVDLVRFANGVEGRGTRAVLQQMSIDAMTARPNLPEYANATSWYGFGWGAQNSGATGRNWYHDGLLAGTVAYLVRRNSGYDLALTFNSRPERWADFENEMVNGVHSTLFAIPNYLNLSGADYYPNFGIADTFPVGQPNGVQQGAVFTQGFSPGSWVTIKGRRLARTTRTWRDFDFLNGRLPEVLDGVRVKINGKPAYVYYVSPTQINVLAPEDETNGPVTIETSLDSEISPPMMGELRRRAPGFFAYASGSRQHVVAVHLDSAVVGDPATVPGTRGGTAGGRAILFGTGFMAAPAGQVATPALILDQPVSIKIGGLDATVEYAGLISPGLFQFNIVVPAGLTPGYHEVVAIVDGAATPTNYFFYVS